MTADEKLRKDAQRKKPKKVKPKTYERDMFGKVIG